MRKITLSILAFGAFILTAQAQTSEVTYNSKEVRFGAKAGLNLANLTNAEDSKVRPNFHVGVLAEFKINEKFSIQPELIYSRQGIKGSFIDADMDGTIYNVDAVMKLDYLNVPVMAKYYIKDGFSIQAGPQIGLIVTAEYEEEIKNEGMSMTVSQDLKSAMRTVDFGLNFGLGYELPVGVFFDARYNVGLSNIFKETFEGDTRTQNSVFQLAVGYKF